MASLVPCTVCRRHVRRHETQCRFCGAERTAEAAAREQALPRDVKRATLFALGLTLAGQACAADNSIAIYGAPFLGGGSGGGGGSDDSNGIPGNGGTGAVGGSGGSSSSDGGSGQVQPVYGAPVSPTGGTGGALPMSAVDAGTDGGNADSGTDAGN